MLYNLKIIRKMFFYKMNVEFSKRKLFKKVDPSFGEKCVVRRFWEIYFS